MESPTQSFEKHNSANPNLSAALAYARRGIPTFPCLPDKRPATPRGFHDATCHQDQIRAWWGAHPEHLIGMPTGAVSGIVVLDVDVDPSKGLDGEEALAELVRQHGPIPETWEVLTPRGGRHIYFRHPGYHVACSASSEALGRGLDVRGDGGYVIAPPSTRPDGSAWAWEGSSDPEEGMTLADMPLWITHAGSQTPLESKGQMYVAPSVITEGGRNDTLFRLGRSLRAKGLTEAAIVAALLAENAGRCDPPLPEAEVRLLAGSACTKPPGASLTAAVGAGHDAMASDGPVHSRDEPAPIADAMLAGPLADMHLLRHQGEYMRWTGTHYTGTDEAGILAEVYRYLDTALRAARTGLVPFGSVKRDVTNVIGALNARCHLPQESCFPGWRGTDGHPAHEVIPMENGLFHYPTETLAAHTPSFLNTSARPFAYSPLATCHGWPDFLDSLWGSDEEAKEALAEIFGYLLSGATNLQKIFLLIGPPRCGKGTIMRVLRALMGEDAYCGPTLSGLTMNFGLQSLIGKSVAVISDARIGARTDQSIAVERLLAVSGEDTITADRKNKTAWTGRMGVRFVLTTNELPRLSDASGALSNRFMPIVLTKSFLGCEDTTLDARLAQDLPGIFLWALDGLKRLNARGRFHVPESSSQLVEEFHDLTSPVGAFVREYCELGTGKKEEVGDVYRAWGRWCLASGRDRQGTTHELARQLRAVVPGLRTTRIQKKGSRNRYYVGIALV